MKIPADAPLRIYLQHDPEKEGGSFADATEITWCKHKINSNDIAYIRADLARKAKRPVRKG